jgi:hypothetical protein
VSFLGGSPTGVEEKPTFTKEEGHEMKRLGVFILMMVLLFTAVLSFGSINDFEAEEVYLSQVDTWTTETIFVGTGFLAVNEDKASLANYNDHFPAEVLSQLVYTDYLFCLYFPASEVSKRQRVLSGDRLTGGVAMRLIFPFYMR